MKVNLPRQRIAWPGCGPRAHRRAPRRGAIALMTMILLPVLFGVGALVVDMARLFVYKAELQNAMDACALAATSALTGINDPNIFDVARARAKALTDPTKVGLAARTNISVNRLHFQHDTLVNANLRVDYSIALSGQPWIEATSTSFAGITPTTAKYARCTYSDANRPLFFAPLLRVFVPGAITQMSVGATAAATLMPAQSACAFPVAVCMAAGGTAANNYGLTVGQRLTAVNNPSSGYGTGNFGWLDFTPPAGGASELAGLIIGSGSCAVGAGNNVGQPGVVNSLQTAWNSRFGVYASGGGVSVTTAPPDFTGYGYATGGGNYADYVTRSAARAQFQGNVAGGNTKATSAQHGTYGQSRRIVTAAVVNCSVWNTNGSANPAVLDFACVLLLAPVRNGGAPSGWTNVSTNMDIEYLGLTRAVGTPCATIGEAGGTYGPPIPALVQ